MNNRRTHFRMAIAVLFALTSAIHAQTFTSIPDLPFETTGPVIQAHAEPLKPFTVAGERGVVLGQQDGTFEAWVLPVKLLSHLTIEADIEGYSVPIEVNQQAAEVEVRPDRTTITYSHTAFTVRQIMFSPERGKRGDGPARSLRIRLPAPHRLHPPLHPRTALDVAASATKASPTPSGSRAPEARAASTSCTATILTWPALSPFRARSPASSPPTRNGPRCILSNSSCTSTRRATTTASSRC